MITQWSAGDPAHNMPDDILVDLAGLIARHPWFRARAGLAVALLEDLKVFPPARVLDVGCGWGLNLEALERRGYRVTGLDISRSALERLDGPGRELIEADLNQPLPSNAGAFDAVLALDVIEHLDDDRGAVGRLAEVTRPGGVAVVSVPALPELYSEFDSVQGHRRRYLPDALRATFQGSGLSVEKILWWGSWLVPLLRRQRRQSRGLNGEPAAATYRRYLTLPPWPIPLALRLAFLLERGRTLRGKTPIGTSLFAVARRPA